MSLSVDDLLDGDFDVFAISTDRTRGGDLDMLHEKQWLAIVTTEWRERVELLHACKIQCAERARGVDGEWALLEIRWRKERIDFARGGSFASSSSTTGVPGTAVLHAPTAATSSPIDALRTGPRLHIT